MKEKYQFETNVTKTFARQIEVATRKELIYQDNPQELSRIWTELRGHEEQIIKLARYVRSSERINLGYLYNDDIGNTLDLISDAIWERLEDRYKNK